MLGMEMTEWIILFFIFGPYKSQKIYTDDEIYWGEHKEGRMNKMYK